MTTKAKPRPFIADRRTALILGWTLFALGGLVLYDAYDRHGDNAPWPLGMILPF